MELVSLLGIAIGGRSQVWVSLSEDNDCLHVVATLDATTAHAIITLGSNPIPKPFIIHSVMAPKATYPAPHPLASTKPKTLPLSPSLFKVTAHQLNPLPNLPP